MFKVIGKLKSDKRGFTLAELLVTITIVSIATVLVTNLIILIIKNYRRVEYRWMIQTITEYVANSFSTNTNREAFCTADIAEIMYDETLEDKAGSNEAFTLPSCPELGTIQFDADHNIIVRPEHTNENLQTLEDGYIYLLTFDKHFYQVSFRDLLKITDVKDADGKVISTTIDWKTDEENGPIKPVSEVPNVSIDEDTDVALDVWFEIAVNPLDYDSTINQEIEGTHTRYLSTALTASVSGKISNKVDTTIKSGIDYVVSFNLDNMDGEEQKINYSSITKRLSTQYAAGWTNPDITVAGSATNLPTEDETEVVKQAEGVNKVVAENITHKANVVRYHSVNTRKDLSDTIGSTYVPSVSGSRPFCMLTKLTVGMDRQTQILEPIRDFRDNVLRGNAVGEWMIDKYYDWSPTVIGWAEESPAFKGIFRVAAKGLAAFATVAVE